MSEHELRPDGGSKTGQDWHPGVEVNELLDLWALGNFLHEWAQDPNSMTDERLMKLHELSTKYNVDSTTALFAFQKQWRSMNITPERELTGHIPRVAEPIQITTGQLRTLAEDLNKFGGSKYGITDFGQRYAGLRRVQNESSPNLLEEVQKSLQQPADPPMTDDEIDQIPTSKEDIEHQIGVLEDLAKHSELGLDQEQDGFLKELRDSLTEIRVAEEARQRAEEYRNKDSALAQPTEPKLITHDPGYTPEGLPEEDQATGRVAIPEAVLTSAMDKK